MEEPSDIPSIPPARPWLPILLVVFLLGSIGATYMATRKPQDIRSQAAPLPSWTHEALPPSLVAPFEPGNWTFTVETTNANLSEWGGAQENQVFFRRLEHKQTNKDWTVKIGKGGQIYSIKTPQTGEMIALQRTNYGQWVDEVFQHVVPMTPQKDPACNSSVVDGDVHQAGYYVNSDQNCDQQIIPQSVYSPRFPSVLSEFLDVPDSISYITWPQHAHLPRSQANNLLLMHQSVRDMGDGVLEITVILNNWGAKNITAGINLPWTAFRTTTVPTQILSQPDGSYRQDNRVFGEDQNPELLRNSTSGGWIAFTQANTPNSHGIGIVYGNYVQGLEKPNSIARWGTYSDGTVATVRRVISFEPGETIFARYYLVIGTLKDIQRYGNLLAGKVQLGKITTSETRAQAIALCPGPDSVVRRGCPNGETPYLYTHRKFLPQSKPLFLLQNNATNRYLITSDPYEISFDPTNGSTRYIDFLGWVLPENARDTSCYAYTKIADGLKGAGITVGASATNLYGRVVGGGTCNATAPPTLPFDFNGDGGITVIDYTMFMDYWWKQDREKGDLNKDGKITIIDYVLFMDAWKKTPTK